MVDLEVFEWVFALEGMSEEGGLTYGSRKCLGGGRETRIEYPSSPHHIRNQFGKRKEKANINHG